MRRWSIALSIFVLASGYTGVAGAQTEINSLAAKVIKVVDGDSVVVETELPGRSPGPVKIRLDGVNAPELKGKCRKERELARLATRYVEDMALGAVVTLVKVRPHRSKSRREMVARIRLKDGTDISAGLISLGFGHHYDGRGVKSWCRGPK